ncbi:hypothetical protein CEXT_470351 [Caerostris extrusa]|uniref:Uncharacterized protein n=1 Tax=Caerostris extrusa TaxID=172846 RepID=A0AAV4XW19_CAEEX|nr:hypothetical protein CEXT_470351 [Caerostris extrusa]
MNFALGNRENSKTTLPFQEMLLLLGEVVILKIRFLCRGEDFINHFHFLMWGYQSAAKSLWCHLSWIFHGIDVRARRRGYFADGPEGPFPSIDTSNSIKFKSEKSVDEKITST